MGGKGFAAHWKSFCSALEQHHYILLYKGQAGPTTRRPARLAAQVEVAQGPGASCQANAAIPSASGW